MRQTWILSEDDSPNELLNQFEGILSSLEGGAHINESWREPGKLVVEMREVEPE